MTSSPPIPRGGNCCLFLDIDGTLLDFAPTPDQVLVDEPLRDLLRGLDRDCEGAIAFVSGRAIVDIDELFEPLYLAAAGIHGCERRDAEGHWRREISDTDSLVRLRDRLAAQLRPLDGVWIEDKGCALAIHFRHAPQLESPLRGALARLGPVLPADLEILDGDCVIEIKPRGYNKATAIEAFMKEAPFAGRIPVFIGDDHTDQDGLDVVRRMNGVAIGVGDRRDTEWHLPDPSAVRGWLESFLQRDR
jgi:trehalose 6-phosphate phosphatase